MRYRNVVALVCADPASVSAVAPDRLQRLPSLIATRASGKSPDGEPLIVQGLRFAQDSEVFAALLYAGSVSPDVVESFFSGLRFR